MRRFTILLLVLMVSLLAACASSSPEEAGSPAGLRITGGEADKTYTRTDLEALPLTESVFMDVAYRGVAVSTLLEDAGLTLSEIKAVKAVASDGYSVNYDPSQIYIDGVIVAYAQADGELTQDDGAFRMVIPGAEGKLNVRMLVELQVIR